MNQIILTICLSLASLYYIYDCIKGENPKILRNISMIIAMVLTIFYQYPIVSQNPTLKMVFLILIIIFLMLGVLFTYKQNRK